MKFYRWNKKMVVAGTSDNKSSERVYPTKEENVTIVRYIKMKKNIVKESFSELNFMKFLQEKKERQCEKMLKEKSIVNSDTNNIAYVDMHMNRTISKSSFVQSLDDIILEAKDSFVNEEYSVYEVMYVLKDKNNIDVEEVSECDDTVYEDVEF